MKRVALFVVALAVAGWMGTTEACAGHGQCGSRPSFGITFSTGPSFGYGGYGYGGGYGYSGYGYAAPVYSAPVYPRGHYDYHPPVIVPHGNHYDYVPGHYHYHRSHRHYGW